MATTGWTTTDTVTYTSGTTATGSAYYEHERRMLEEQIRANERHRMAQEKPSPNHHWSEYERRWIDTSRAVPPWEEDKVTKKKSFFERLQAEVDDWIKDVELGYG